MHNPYSKTDWTDTDRVSVPRDLLTALTADLAIAAHDAEQAGSNDLSGLYLLDRQRIIEALHNS